MTATALPNEARATGLERTYALVERKIGRPLRDPEKAIDILKLDAALERAKDDLDQAIHTEMLRATRAWARAGEGPFPALAITARMRAVLADLERLGRDEGVLELERLGYRDIRKGHRSYKAHDPIPGGGIPEILSTMDLGLAGLRVRIQDELVHADLGAASEDAIARALLQVPGGRDIASRVISTALTSGFAATFEENAHLVGGWEYTAVLDGGTCEVCAPLDGSRYATLPELFQVLPNFGPNPSCRGGGRCRCRAVPLPPGIGAAGPVLPPPSGDAFTPPPEGHPAVEKVADALAAISAVHLLPAGPATVPLRLDRSLAADGADGEYSAETNIIRLHPDAEQLTFTTLHEVGHAIDDLHIGTPGEMASWSGDPLMADWIDAIGRSERIQQYLRTLDSPAIVAYPGLDEHLEYLLLPPEAFARSYAQWIATRSGNTAALAAVDDDLASALPRQWTLTDFAPIGRALDQLARALHWTQ